MVPIVVWANCVCFVLLLVILLLVEFRTLFILELHWHLFLLVRLLTVQYLSRIQHPVR